MRLYEMFYLESLNNDKDIRLYGEMNSIFIDGNSLLINDFDVSFDSSELLCVILFKNNNICIKHIAGLCKVNDEFIDSLSFLHANDIIQLQNLKFKFKNNIRNNEIYELVDLYKNGELPDFWDLEQIFLKYAILLKITDRQTGFIMASIDIPEIDKNIFKKKEYA